MQRHLILNGVDYTPYIVEGSYKIDSDDVYESWNDGNMVEHRIVVTSKVSGSVQLLCSELGRWPKVSELLADINAATDNHVLTCGVYVPSRGAVEAINCYFNLVSSSHIKSLGGKLTDVFTLEIKER